MEKIQNNNGNIESMDIRPRFNSLKNELRAMGSAAVAFSGGVDSTFLLKVACRSAGR